ncbi:MAG TPA: GGDEF domain-containing protein [Phycisphaerae bacterium]|nr:GGDEF domain-containing protein [Phycisphaerae bacterium]HRY66896.1 GGDEF domain-containing protein [Phycisphaerae bacterium]HSA26955.1 GGDEF domain-containing protein [Phycisphaerae bacterium]
MMSLNTVTSSFLDWWSAQDTETCLWPAFDLFVRETLLDIAGAKRVRLFHTAENGQVLRSLSQDARGASGAIAPTALMGHVLNLGRVYVQGDWSHGPMVDRLAAESAQQVLSSLQLPEPGSGRATQNPRPVLEQGPVAWMFPILSPASPEANGGAQGAGRHAVGLVVVGDLPETSLSDRSMLDGLSQLISAFWLHVRDYESLQIARRTDRGSGVLNRADFLSTGESATAEARREGEPIVVMAVAVEGLRRFDDLGQWTLRDRIILEAGRVLRRKLRNDDLVGRFSDDRFVVLLRWLDVGLGRLIAEKVIGWVREAVQTAVGGPAAGPGKENPGEIDSFESPSILAVDSVRVRCGLASNHRVARPRPETAEAALAEVEGLPVQRLTFADLLKRALAASGEARRLQQDLCVADEAPPARPSAAPSQPQPAQQAVLCGEGQP